jgi:phosphopantothenoylcysteine decarboxylase/phosphopantothenate--cysteine ligase
VVALTGSIVAGLMAPVILSLCYSGFYGQLDVILTEAALRFVHRELFEFYGIRTWVDAFDRRDGVHVPHIALGQAADCLLVMPASAACWRRLAQGACADLLSLTVAATMAPVVVAPVMNTAMWNHAAVQRNVQQMRDDGMYVIEPTLIFAAVDLVHQGDPMYGGPGTFWRGALGVMHTLVAAMDHHRRR